MYMCVCICVAIIILFHFVYVCWGVYRLQDEIRVFAAFGLDGVISYDSAEGGADVSVFFESYGCWWLVWPQVSNSATINRFIKFR